MVAYSSVVALAFAAARAYTAAQTANTAAQLGYDGAQEVISEAGELWNRRKADLQRSDMEGAAEIVSREITFSTGRGRANRVPPQQILTELDEKTVKAA